MLGNPIAGMSWEGFVIENILGTIDQDRIGTSYYGKSSENEIDLVLEKPNKDIWAIEIKRSQAPKFTKGYRIASEEIGSKRNFIIYPGKDKYRIEKNTEVIGLAEFLKVLEEESRV